ncbi:MAG: tRNA lysidine(34) synthetase TilS [Candidatus Moranbacteria bacterium]|nr:tRNA lysidine(34) synthetase TilS [Candidatus Moranbacteria bacterium]
MIDPLVSKVNTVIKKKQLIADGDLLIVGTSGGPDSICLLFVLKQLQKIYNLRLIAAHVNYQTRKEDSKSDERLVKNFCHELDIECMVKKITLQRYKPTNNFEELARRIRYTFFSSIAKKNLKKFKTSKIKAAVAHNANDQAETVLLNLVRGSGIKGLGAMAFESANFDLKIIRPMLDLKKSEIINYLNKKKVPYRIDKSNLSLKYSRNKIRHQIIPLFEEMNPKFIETVSRNSALIRETNEILEIFTNKLINKLILREKPKKIILKRKLFNKQHSIMQAEVLRNIFKKINKNTRNLSNSQIEKALSYISRSSGKKSFKEIKKLTITKKGDTLIFEDT